MIIDFSNQQYLSIDIEFTFPRTVFNSVVAYILLPSSLSFVGSGIIAQKDGIFLSPSATSYDPITNKIKINPFTFQASKSVITVQCSNVNRPRSAFFLENITIQAFKEVSGVEYLMATIVCCQQELQPRSALDGSLSVNDPQLLKTGVTYTFTFTISQHVSLQTDDMVYIYFPYQYQIPTGTISCTV